MKCLAAVVLLAASLASPVYAGEVRLQIANGRVTLQARDATVREILAEWARVGQVKIVNAERIAGVPVTLDFQGLPEAQALATLLRSVSGFMASTRLASDAAPSMYDRIVILATPRTTTASASTYSTPLQPQQPQQFRGGMPPGMPNPAMLDEQDEPTGAPPTFPGAPPGYVPPNRGFFTPNPGAVNQPAGTVPQGTPGTVSPVQNPGMQVQPGTVVQPGGTGAPGTVTQPVKKPGGPGGTGDQER